MFETAISHFSILGLRIGLSDAVRPIQRYLAKEIIRDTLELFEELHKVINVVLVRSLSLSLYIYIHIFNDI